MNGTSNTRIYVYSASLLGAVILSAMLVMWEKSPQHVNGVMVSFFVLPLIPILFGKLISGIIKRFLAGGLAQAFDMCASRLGWTIGAFVFFFTMPGAPSVNAASFGMLMLLPVSGGWCFLPLVQNRIITAAVLKALFFAILAAAFRFMLLELASGGDQPGIIEAGGDMIFLAFMGTGLCCLLSIVRIIDNAYLKAAGDWFETGLAKKFFFICAAVFVFKILRNIIMDRAPGSFWFIEWVVLFAAMAIAFIVVFLKLQHVTQYPYTDTLRKHVQEFKYAKGTELNRLTNYINQFIDSGEKSGLITYMMVTAQRADMSEVTIGSTLKPLIDYRDRPVPAMILRRELEVLHRKNRESRMKVLEYTINEINKCGRKSYEY